MLLGDWLDEKPFTLSLSSGFFAFFAHMGMLAAILDAGLRPSRVTGSSAGALVGGCWAAGVPVADMLMLLERLDKRAFWDPAPGLGLLKGERFRALLRDLTGDPQMESLPVPAAISVWRLSTRSTCVVENGALVTAISASCAVPLLLQPVRVQGGLCWDGGILDRHGLAGRAPGERTLYHHIQSRSPWRRPNSPALAVPRQGGLTGLVIEGLPRSGPSRLEHGRRALAMARSATRQALDRPIDDGLVQVSGVQDAAS